MLSISGFIKGYNTKVRVTDGGLLVLIAYLLYDISIALEIGLQIHTLVLRT